MPEYRLGKVSQEFNRSCLTIADLLKSKGYVIDKVNPTLKITEEQYKLCLAEFTKNNQNKLDPVLKKPMLSLTSKNKYKFSKQKFRPEIKKTIICSVCGCSLLGKAPFIHDCKVKNFLEYKKSRLLGKSDTDFLMNYFNFSRINVPIDKNEIKKLDNLLISQSTLETMQSIVSDSQIRVDFKLVSDLYTGKFNEERVVLFGSEEVLTVFTNDEVIHLAFGVKQSEVSRLARKYLKGVKLENSEWVFLHNTMMKGVKELGKNHIQQLLNLEKVELRTSQHIVLFNMLHKISQEVNNPVIRIEYNGLTYICEFVSQSNKLNKDIIQISENKINENSQRIFTINKNGTIVSTKNNGIIPTFQLVQAICINTRQLIIGYGLKEGRCSICNKPLTDSLSKQKGIGPICEKNISLV